MHLVHEKCNQNQQSFYLTQSDQISVLWIGVPRCHGIDWEFHFVELFNQDGLRDVGSTSLKHGNHSIQTHITAREYLLDNNHKHRRSWRSIHLLFRWNGRGLALSSPISASFESRWDRAWDRARGLCYFLTRNGTSG